MLTPLIDQYHILFSSLSMLVSLMFGSLLLVSTELIHYYLYWCFATRTCVCNVCNLVSPCISNDKMHFGH